MNLKTALSLSRGGRLRILWQVTKLFDPFYRIVFAASAGSCGLLELLANGPKTFEEIAVVLAPDAPDGLRAWLGLGVKLGELDEGPSGFALEGLISRRLADSRYDDIAAVVEEVVTHHHRLILETPRRWKRREPWPLSDHDGCLIARSSRILEPFVFQAIDWGLPDKNPVHLLELGAGSGTYVRYAAERNPRLTAIALELQDDVTRASRANFDAWGLADRVEAKTGDIRDWQTADSFDAVTLYNLIYYFPVAERVGLFRKLRALTKAGGRLIMTSSCQRGSPGIQLLNIWTSNTHGLGRLPTVAELVEQLIEAGWQDVKAKKMIPGDDYYALLGFNPA